MGKSLTVSLYNRKANVQTIFNPYQLCIKVSTHTQIPKGANNLPY